MHAAQVTSISRGLLLIGSITLFFSNPKPEIVINWPYSYLDLHGKYQTN